ncbi:MAG: ABC transporter transmembrane domain-containing protein [Bacteroidota bacterium]
MMAKGRRSSGEETAPEDKKRITKKGLKHIWGIFSFVLPYKWTFLLGMVFLLLSTGATLTFPYFLGELIDSASPPSLLEQEVRVLQNELNSGKAPGREELDRLKSFKAEDDLNWQAKIQGLENKLEEGDALSRTDLEALLVSKESRQTEAVDSFLNSSDINQVALALVVVLALQGLFSFLRIYLFAQVSERGMADIRSSLYQKIITLPMEFFEQKRVGELTSRISSDVTQLQDMLSYTLAEFLRQILTLLIGIVLISWVSSKLTLFMLASFPLLVIAAMIFGRFIRKLSKKAQDELATSNTLVEESFQAIRVVKAFTNEWKESIAYRKSLKAVVKTALKAATYRGFFVSFIFIALFGGIILVIWRGAQMIQTGEIETGQLLSFLIYTAFIGGSVAGMGNLYGQIQKTVGASERILEILGREPEFVLQKPQEVPTLQGAISFENVSFAYPSRPEISILENFTLHIQPGEKIALVGQSGAGKSTITRLLLRFYDIAEGTLWIDGKSINSFSLPVLRGNIGIVPQEVILFGGTIRENIAYGKPDATDEEVRQAAQRAYAWEFIQEFPEGWDTIVGERGIQLSGGQRQRVAIARALLKDPAILILDEATSSLDAESERFVQSALDELMQNRTTLVIAHRLSTIRKVDTICVIENGKIVEMGSHMDLTQQEDGAYKHLLKLQLE